MDKNVVYQEDKMVRLDKFLSDFYEDFSRVQWRKLIDEGQVFVNQKIASADYRLTSGDAIDISDFPERQVDTQHEPEDVAFKVLEEKTSYLLVNKPAGLVVHPGAGVPNGTLMNGLLYRYPELASLPRAGLVHRLDKDTSGLILIARNEKAYQFLAQQMHDRQIEKKYWALSWGDCDRTHTIEKNIGRDPHHRTKMAVLSSSLGRYALTVATPFMYSHRHRVSLIECRIATGRTHQIRVHLSSVKLPIVGDELYSPRHLFLKSPIQRQCLHAKFLSFICPDTKVVVSYRSRLPEDIMAVLDEWDMSFPFDQSF